MNHRSIRDDFWQRPQLRGLGFAEKGFLLYLLTNSHRHLAGIYRLPLPYACTDTGLDEETVLEAFATLEERRVAFYDRENEIVLVPCALSTDNHKVSEGLGRKITTAVEKLQGPLVAKFFETHRELPGINQELVKSQSTPNGELSNSPDTDTDTNKKKPTKSTNHAKKSDYSDAFLKFWQAYPKRTGKGAAYRRWREWRKAHSDGEQGLLRDCLAAIEWQRNSREWREGFIKNPETWLNQRCWEDEPSSGLSPPAYGIPPPAD